MVEQMLKRRGRKGEVQRDLWEALEAIAAKYADAWRPGELFSFLYCETQSALPEIERRMRARRRRSAKRLKDDCRHTAISPFATIAGDDVVDSGVRCVKCGQRMPYEVVVEYDPGSPREPVGAGGFARFQAKAALFERWQRGEITFEEWKAAQ